MDTISLINTAIACLIGFLVSIISVVVGGTSLITVPLLISLGLTSRGAIATNKFALIFLSLSGAINFRREVKIDTPGLIIYFLILTIIGSIIGANLVIALSDVVLKKIIGSIMIVILFITLSSKELGVIERKINISWKNLAVGSLIVLPLSVYSGFFSGGYVTILSYSLILIYGFSFLQVATITKILNIFSSIVACIVFAANHLIIYSIAIPLAISMCLGAFIGVKLSLKKGNIWVKRIFSIFVVILAIKLFFF